MHATVLDRSSTVGQSRHVSQFLDIQGDDTLGRLGTPSCQMPDLAAPHPIDPRTLEDSCKHLLDNIAAGLPRFGLDTAVQSLSRWGLDFVLPILELLPGGHRNHAWHSLPREGEALCEHIPVLPGCRQGLLRKHLPKIEVHVPCGAVHGLGIDDARDL